MVKPRLSTNINPAKRRVNSEIAISCHPLPHRLLHPQAVREEKNRG
jgi:hypothetical protein